MTPKPQCEPLISASEAAKILNCSPKTVLRRAKAGIIPAVPWDRTYKFRASALDAWITEQLQSSHSLCPSQRSVQ